MQKKLVVSMHVFQTQEYMYYAAIIITQFVSRVYGDHYLWPCCQYTDFFKNI